MGIDDVDGFPGQAFGQPNSRIAGRKRLDLRRFSRFLRRAAIVFRAAGVSRRIGPGGRLRAGPGPGAFPAAGITRVVLRAADADKATVTTRMAGTAIEIGGIPVGGAQGYHSSDPNWRETPAAKWGLDFVSERRGATLIVSTKNELHYIHHHYAFESLTVRVPTGVEVVKEPRTLTGDGAPDLH